MHALVRSHWPVHLLTAALAGFLLAGCARQADRAAVPEPGFSLRDIDGVEHRPFADPDVRAVTLVFVLADCPIANAYAPEINRLCREFGGRGVRFFLVQVDPDLLDDEARQHARSYGYPCPVVADRRHVLVERAGATVVPEAAVFGPDGERLYRGRIDDQYADLGKRRPQVTSRDLCDALDAVLAGRAVERPVTPAVGCFIPPLSPKDPPP
jgi:hypothetical protein